MENSLILTIETAGKIGGVAVIGNSLLGSITIQAEKSYSQVLFKCLEFLTQTLNLSLDKINFYAIDLGPGSFTGLRIGVSVLKGLNLVYPRPVIPLVSLEILASEVTDPTYPIVSMIDAYSSEVFLGVYRWEKHILTPKIRPCLVSLKKLPELIEEPSYFVSETIEKWEGFLKETLKEKFKKWPFPVNLGPEKSAKLALYKLRNSQAEIKYAEDILPLYLKPSEAERKKCLSL